MPGEENVIPPYTSFNFEVILTLKNPPSTMTSPVCKAAFAECDGLEMTMEAKAIREGGHNQVYHHRTGPISYGQLTLKRGMTGNFDLWQWFDLAGQAGRDSTATGQINLLDASGQARVTFILNDCLPTKIKGPSLHAQNGQIAMEEMQLVYSRLTVRAADASASAGPPPGVVNRVSGGEGLSTPPNAGASITGGLNL
jgi:phage tail-like protein